MARLLICDDSPTMRLALRRLLGQPGLDIVAEAKDGQEAVRLAALHRPDLITMDVLMPGLDGLSATREILRQGPARIVIVSAAGDSTQDDLSFQALAAGATELFPKPSALSGRDLESWGAELSDRLRHLAGLQILPRGAALAPSVGARGSEALEAAVPEQRSFAAFALVASTGGPPALAQLIEALPATLPYPVLIAQHIATGFTEGLRRWLKTRTPLDVRVAYAGEVPQPGRIYLAPDGMDMEWGSDGRLRLGANEGGVCPNGDRLLKSLLSLKSRVGAAVLTGMGRDGAEGLLALRQVGALTLAQDAASCTVDGMPDEAWTRGGAMARVNLIELGHIMAQGQGVAL